MISVVREGSCQLTNFASLTWRCKQCGEPELRPIFSVWILFFGIVQFRRSEHLFPLPCLAKDRASSPRERVASEDSRVILPPMLHSFGVRRDPDYNVVLAHLRFGIEGV